jgi:hypothetical protein
VVGLVAVGLVAGVGEGERWRRKTEWVVEYPHSCLFGPVGWGQKREHENPSMPQQRLVAASEQHPQRSWLQQPS